MLDFFVQFFTDYGYFAVFGILILCGFGLPVPEDITLVSGGVISGLGYTNVHFMCFIGLAGVLIGDSTMFLAGRLFGYRIQRIRLFRRILSPRRFSQIQRKFKQYGLGLLFVARFLPGLRSPIYLVSGMSRRVSFITFILMDGCAALISVPVWIYLGYFFADNLDLLMEYVGDVQKAIYLALGLLVVIILVIYLKKRFHQKLNAIAGDDHHATPATSASTTDATTTASASTTATASFGTAASLEGNTIAGCDCSTTSSSNVATTANSNTVATASPDTATQAATISNESSANAANATNAATSYAAEKTQNVDLAEKPQTDQSASAEANSDPALATSPADSTSAPTSTEPQHVETHEEILSKRIKDKRLISKLSKASSLAAAGKGHSQFNPGIGNHQNH